MNLVIKDRIKRYDNGNIMCDVVDDDTHYIKLANCSEEEAKEYIEKHQPKLIIDKRKKKLSEIDLIGWDYICSKPITYTNKNKNIKVKGILFYFRVLNQKEIYYILNYKNTEILTVERQYAPEIKYKGVAIYEKCIR